MSLDALDAALFSALNGNLNIPPLNPIMVFITEHNPFVFLVLFAFFWRQNGKKSFMVLLFALAAFGLADWTAHSLKEIIMRPRPCRALEELVLLVRCGKGFSMPSNHAANSFAFALPFFILGKGSLRWVFMGFAALVAYSRVYVGVHYPSDILAGALLGSALGWTVVFAYRKIYPRHPAIDEPEDAQSDPPAAAP